MKTVKIVSRWNSEREMFSFEVPEGATPAMALRLAVLQAVSSGVDLRYANLSGVDLRGADLRGADLSGVDLRGFRDDVWAVLSSAPREAGAVLAALQDGKVDGSTYPGTYACLVGTIANARGCNYEQLGALKPASSRLAETWFMQIKPGHTPVNHEPTRIAAEWVAQWLDAMHAAFAPREVAP